jgi:glycosyltransferase involved in cell wall biosynthesis
VIPVPIALSDEKGVAKMSVRGGGSSFFRHLSNEFVEVQVERLDDFVEREKIERVDAIKIDVEGAELRVIRGAEVIAEAMEAIWDDGALRTELRRRSLERARLFTPQRTLEQLLAAYERALSYADSRQQTKSVSPREGG